MAELHKIIESKTIDWRLLYLFIVDTIRIKV